MWAMPPAHHAGSTAGSSSNRVQTRSLLGRVELLPRILDLVDGLELDIGEVIALLLDAADVDVLHHVARLRVDHDGPARAVRVLPPREDLHRLVAIRFALGLLDDREDRGHAVPAADRHEAGRRLRPGWRAGWRRWNRCRR